MIQNVHELTEKSLVDITSFQSFYDSVYERLKHISDYIIVPASDVLLNGLLRNRKKKLEECYYNINDWTRKKKRVLDLWKACIKLENLGMESEEIEEAHAKLLEKLRKELEED